DFHRWKRFGRSGLFEVHDAWVGGGFLKNGQITKIHHSTDARVFNKTPQVFAITRAHPFIGENVAELAAFAEHRHSALYKIYVQVGGSGSSSVVRFQVRFHLAKFLLSDIRR